MKVLINKSFVVVEGKELVPYYMNKEYELEDSVAKDFVEKGLAKVVETKKAKKEVKKEEEVVEETKPKTTRNRKKKTEEK